MESHRFDRFAKDMATVKSRRGVLKALGAATLGAIGTLELGSGARAKDQSKSSKSDHDNHGEDQCRGERHPCEGNQTCCGGLECRASNTGSAKRCEQPACKPTTCADQNVSCGSIPDGCGGVLTCGACQSPLTCGGGGVPGQCGCNDDPVATTCAGRCGAVINNCGHSRDCGPCCTGGGQVCANDAGCCSGACDQGICLGQTAAAGDICDSHADCLSGLCCQEQCADPATFTSDPHNCGACGVVCSSGACLEGDCAACLPGSTRSCYSGPAGTAGIGICTVGVQTCLSDGSGYDACQGEVLPRAESCNGIDDDCDGDVDNGDLCAPRANATGSCVDGDCVYTCNSGYSLCGDTCVDFASDSSNCGACGTVCSSTAHGIETCSGGVCVVSACDSGFVQCGSICETCDQALGSTWSETENGFTGTWTRTTPGGNQWSGVWNNGARGTMTITCSGRSVTIHRVDTTGHSAGLTAEYTGTLSDDCHSISGQESVVHGPLNPWSATITG